MKMLKVIVLLFTSLASSSVFAVECCNWEWRNPFPQGDNLNRVKFINGHFAAVGFSSILFSDDGINWVSKYYYQYAGFTDITWNGSEYIAGGSDGFIYKSSDGNQWLLNFPPFTYNNPSIVKLLLVSDSIYVIYHAGSQSYIYQRDSNSIWHLKFTSAATLFDLVWNGSLFVAVANNGAYFTSGDGATWAPQNIGLSQDITRIIWDGSQFLASTADHVATSTDATTWSLGNTVGSGAIRDILFDGVKYLALEENNTINVSSDAIKWDQYSTNSPYKQQSIAFGNNQYVLVGRGGLISFSDDGVSWNVETRGIAGDLHKLVFSGEIYIAVGQGGSILKSTDSYVWNSIKSGIVDDLYSVIWDGRQFIAVGDNNTIITSADGEIWQPATLILPSIYTGAYRDLVFNGNKYVVIGLAGMVAVSDDGITWNHYQQDALDRASLAWSGTAFVAVGDKGVVTKSVDGVNWTSKISHTGQVLRKIIWDGSQFTVMGSGVILESADGEEWKASNLTADVFDITYGSGLYVAIAPNLSLTTRDLYGWLHSQGDNYGIYIVYWDGSQFLGAGTNGSIYVNTLPLVTYPATNSLASNSSSSGSGATNPGMTILFVLLFLFKKRQVKNLGRTSSNLNI